MTSCPSTIKEAVKVWEGTLKPMAASDEMTGNNNIHTRWKFVWISATWVTVKPMIKENNQILFF